MDEVRREPERRAADGDARADAQVLAEQFRRGEVSRVGIVLAGRAGDASARDVLGDAPLPSVSAEFVTRHGARLASLRPVLRSGLRSGWRPEETASLLGILAAVAGHEALAERIFSLEATVSCPECGVRFAPLGPLEGAPSTS